MFKQKRAFLGEGATNTPLGATNQNIAVPQTNNQPMVLGPQRQDESLIYMSIEQALQSADQMPLLEFISMA